MDEHKDVLILGAGIAGCAAAQEFQARNEGYILLEKNSDPGGLTRSISLGEALFDYTGHYLSLNTCRTPADLPHAHQRNDDWQSVKRKSVVYVQGRAVPAPLQYNLFALPEKVREQCILDFRSRSRLDRFDSFQDYLRAGFGEALCRLFLFPYNRKQLAISLLDLAAESANRFFPKPDDKLIEEGYARREEGLPSGYNSTFWYPARGGIRLLSEGLAQGLEGLATARPVSAVSLDKRKATTPAGTVAYDSLLVTAPLKQFCEWTDSPRLKELGRSLSHNRVLCLNLLVQGRLPEMFEGCHWIYFPEAEVPFYRMGIYSNIPGFPVPKSHTSLYIELAFGPGQPPPHLAFLLDSVWVWLEKKGWILRQDCKVVAANWIDCGYVHFTPLRASRLEEIFTLLASKGVRLAGRYGLWDYLTMEETIFSGVAAARGILEGK